jgi:hypothetical protein
MNVGEQQVRARAFEVDGYVSGIRVCEAEEGDRVRRLFDALEAETGTWLERAERERANLRAALGWALADENGAEAFAAACAAGRALTVDQAIAEVSEA